MMRLCITNGVHSHLLTSIADKVLHPEVEVGRGGVAVAALALQLLHVGLVVAALLLMHRNSVRSDKSRLCSKIELPFCAEMRKQKPSVPVLQCAVLYNTDLFFI
jgi:hypothetical protein